MCTVYDAWKERPRAAADGASSFERMSVAAPAPLRNQRWSDGFRERQHRHRAEATRVDGAGRLYARMPGDGKRRIAIGLARVDEGASVASDLRPIAPRICVPRPCVERSMIGEFRQGHAGALVIGR